MRDLIRSEELLSLEMLRPENIKDTLHAYQIAKRCNEKRVIAEAVKWGEHGRAFDVARRRIYHRLYDFD